MKIYTKRGDKGKTGIRGGERVDKDDIRIEANGTLDELNSAIGVVRAYLAPEHEWQLLLFRIQQEIMVVMSQVATPSAIRESNPNKIDEEMVCLLEESIDRLCEKMGGNNHFILPGGNLISAHLHIARVISRRAERRLWTLHKKDELPSTVIPFINRLSDLFFTMARFEAHSSGTTEEKWKRFGHTSQ